LNERITNPPRKITAVEKNQKAEKREPQSKRKETFDGPLEKRDIGFQARSAYTK